MSEDLAETKNIRVVTENDQVFFFDSKDDLDCWVREWSPSEEQYYGGVALIEQEALPKYQITEKYK